MGFFRALKDRLHRSVEVDRSVVNGPCSRCWDAISRCLETTQQGGHSICYEGRIWSPERPWLREQRACAVCKIIRQQLQDRDSDRITVTLGAAPAVFLYIEPCSLVDDYHAPRQDRNTTPGLGDVHVARVDLFSVEGFASDVDITSFDSGEWKGIQRDIPLHMSDEATLTLIRNWMDI